LENVSADGTISILEEAPPEVDGSSMMLALVTILVLVAVFTLIFGNSVIFNLLGMKTKDEIPKSKLEE
jgi:hypothetical protein